MTEDELLTAITDAATWKGWRWFHVRRSDKALQMGHSGFPDLVLAKGGDVLFLELKSSSGKPSPDQMAWLSELSSIHVYARLVRPDNLDEILSLL